MWLLQELKDETHGADELGVLGLGNEHLDVLIGVRKSVLLLDFLLKTRQRYVKLYLVE